MGEEVYLEGDPEVDSTRRHMERVLKGAPRPRRWPWFAAALGGGGLWALWRLGQDAARTRSAPDPGKTAGTPSNTAPRDKGRG
jgi:hypothetical protein